ncbi:MAG: hypothetical protein DWP92_10155, partial [Armatimonadetes bacterium]
MPRSRRLRGPAAPTCLDDFQQLDHNGTVESDWRKAVRMRKHARWTPRRERGATLVLAFLTLLILIVILGDVSVRSSVEFRIAHEEVRDLRYDYAARAGFEVAKALLVQDARHPDSAPIEEAQLAEGAPLAIFAGVEGFELPDRDEMGDVGEGEPAPAASRPPSKQGSVDSFQDVWADPDRCRLTYAGDIDVEIRIIDEDSKVNLLCLVAEDEMFRWEWRDRIVLLLDTLREGTWLDLSVGEAERLADGFEDWFRGRNRGPVPRPYLSTMTRQENGAVWSESRFGNEQKAPVVFPLSLDELLHVKGVTSELMDGTYEDGRYVPGLRDVFTVHTSLVYDPHDSLHREPYVWPFMKRQKGYQDRMARKREEQRRTVEGMARQSGAGRVNLNTAPREVLRVLVEHAGLPAYAMDALLEARPVPGLEATERTPIRERSMA